MKRMIIEVPEEVLWDIENGHVEDRNVYEYANLIHKGTPLPKGHGRLIDADSLEDYIKEDADEWDKYALDYVDDAPTIIEADKAESEVDI